VVGIVPPAVVFSKKQDMIQAGIVFIPFKKFVGKAILPEEREENEVHCIRTSSALP
jgi:formylmethanofuran dehydrogenase subunit D